MDGAIGYGSGDALRRGVSPNTGKAPRRKAGQASGYGARYAEQGVIIPWCTWYEFE
jgi:hypothetical protein